MKVKFGVYRQKGSRLPSSHPVSVGSAATTLVRLTGTVLLQARVPDWAALFLSDFLFHVEKSLWQNLKSILKFSFHPNSAHNTC